MRIENWCGHDIRFIEQDEEWWAILSDICDALGLKTFKVSQRLDPNMMIRVPVETERIRPTKYNKSDNYGILSKYAVNSSASTTIVHMIAVNEIGIYEALFASRKLEARKFRQWSASVMQKLRKSVGLEGYQVMEMISPDIQKKIDDLLDALYWDEEKKCVMRSITVQGGDVEQVPFEV